MTMDQWNRRTEVPLGGAAALFLVAYAWPIINPNLNQGIAVAWALTTVTTVGYGDQFPVTDRGRVVAAVLMLGGIALIGMVTATLASYLVEAVEDDREAVSERAQILAEIAALRRDIAALAPGDIRADAPESAERPGS